jgi:hypothetical protein
MKKIFIPAAIPAILAMLHILNQLLLFLPDIAIRAIAEVTPQAIL